MDSSEKEIGQAGLLERFRKSWFPPAAVVGAFAAFVAAAFRTRPAPRTAVQNPAPRNPDAGRRTSDVGRELPILQGNKPARPLDREYSQSAVLGGRGSAHPFQRSLAGIAVGTADRIYALGDGQIRVFDATGSLAAAWYVSENALCLTVAPDGRVCVGALGRVDVYDVKGVRIAGFAVGEAKQPAAVTAVKVFRQEILVADADARLIRRYDLGGKQLGLIGDKSKTGSFMLPNRWLDFDIDSKGIIRATDTGRHLMTAWTLDGTPVGSFGRFGMSDPADFVGCCNPVNLALTPDGKIVTAEKMVARVKVFEADGKLLAVIGPEHFDQSCTHIPLAVDSRGRILAGDPVQRQVKIFSPVAGAVKRMEQERS